MVRCLEWIIVGGDTLAKRKRRNARQVTLSIAPTTNPVKEGTMANRRIPRLTGRDLDRFWSKVDKPGGEDACWEWRAGKNALGYGEFCLGGRTWKHRFRAHRVSYYIATGEDPGSLNVCHRCDNPPSVRPAHLFLGTAYDNAHDMISKGRSGYTETDEATVIDLREFYAAGKGTVRDAAREFGVLEQVAGNIIRGDTWRHLGGPTFSEDEIRRKGSLGTRNAQAKIAERDVRSIRRIYSSRDISMKALGKQFGVSASTVCMIVNRQRWSHVD